MLHRRTTRRRSVWGKLGLVLRSRDRAAAGTRPFELALMMFAGTALLLIVVILILLTQSTAGPYWAMAGFIGVGVVYLIAGLFAWRRRPSNRMGPLIVIGGLVNVLAALANVPIAGVAAVGQVIATVPLTIIVHLLLAFPSGRLRSRPSKVIVAVGYVVCLPLQLPLIVFSPATAPYDALVIADRPELYALGGLVQSMLGLAVMVATTVVLIRRLRAATPAQRRVLIPLGAYGILAALSLPLGQLVLSSVGVDPITIAVIQMVVLAGIPVAFAWCVLRGGFARTAELDELSAWLSSGAPDRPRLATAVGRALGDPSVTVGYPLGDGALVDAAGHRVPVRPGERGFVDIDLEGRKVATISYDAELITQPEHVGQAGRLVAIELDRERLTAELLAGREELQRSRARIVAEADRERRRIASDLHDGLQAQLVVLSLVAGALAADEVKSAPQLRSGVDQLRRDLDATAADLRRLVHGLMPAILVERGLYAAARALIDALPVSTELSLDGIDDELPEVVETTAYFVLAEALTNAVKHAQAEHIAVRIARTEEHLAVEVSDDGIGGAVRGRGGLRGLSDRVTVLGGRLAVDSPAGAGTRITAEVACAS